MEAKKKAPEEEEEHKMVQLFRQQNPDLPNFEVVSQWSKPVFRTFREWTLLIHANEQYIFIYANEYLENQEFVFWGQ